MSRRLLAVALAVGALVAYVDSRPTWDDTGVTAGAVFVTCMMLGYLGPRRPWLWALAVGAWIPIIAIVQDKNYAAVLALAVAFAGAYAGMALRKVRPPVAD